VICSTPRCNPNWSACQISVHRRGVGVIHLARRVTQLLVEFERVGGVLFGVESFRVDLDLGGGVLQGDVPHDAGQLDVVDLGRVLAAEEILFLFEREFDGVGVVAHDDADAGEERVGFAFAGQHRVFGGFDRLLYGDVAAVLAVGAGVGGEVEGAAFVRLENGVFVVVVGVAGRLVFGGPDCEVGASEFVLFEGVADFVQFAELLGHVRDGFGPLKRFDLTRSTQY
jgi:hypothetical protein